MALSNIFMKTEVRNLLKDITRFEDKILFAKRQVKKLKTPKMVFMTDIQLKKAKELAYLQIQAKVQMPPIVEIDNSEPKVLAKNPEIVGYNKHKILFVDIGPGYTRKDRLMSVRESDGTLRLATHEERSRLNHMFFPSPVTSLDPPKLFEGEHLASLLKRREYVFILNRACQQFEPNDSRYHEVTNKVYDYIDDCSDFRSLRSTRFFGPMALYLAYNKRADNLIIEMLAKNFLNDASKLVQIYNTCHDITLPQDINEPQKIIEYYTENHSSKKSLVELALQACVMKNLGLGLNIKQENVAKPESPDSELGPDSEPIKPTKPSD